MNLTKNLKRTKIKKECIKEKFNWIINTSTLVLFFHYTGSKKSNWEIVKKDIFTNKDNVNCKGLIVPSNLSALLQSNKKLGFLRTQSKSKMQNICANRFLGSTLLIGCESLEQLCVLVKTCKAPNFYCVGGLYGQENVLTHLDIKRCISLGKSLQLENNPQMTPKAKMCATLLCSLGPYTKNWLLVLERFLLVYPAPVHLMLHNALSFLTVRKQVNS